MTGDTKKPLLKKLSFWAIIGVIFAAIIGSSWTYYLNRRGDFILSIDTIQNSVKPGETKRIKVSINIYDGYKKSVKLDVSGKPDKVYIDFQPPVTHADFGYTSTMIVTVGSDVTEGDYKIIITGSGNDGKEHSCPYYLTVLSKTLKPPETPGGIEGTKGTTENLGENLYKIGYDGITFGYLKLPSEIDMITLYLMEGNKPKEGSTVIMEDLKGEEINMISRDDFLKNLGNYINSANIHERKLIISAHGEKTQWYAANVIKFGKDPKNLKYLKQIKMWHPVVNKVIEMQGWINYP
ncbi:MAG: hypothetical protein WC358_03165 [Ignavibacteria bacterium]|jgi:hypothetical protein